MFNIIEVLVGLLASAVLYSQILKDYLKEGKLLIGVLANYCIACERELTNAIDWDKQY